MQQVSQTRQFVEPWEELSQKIADLRTLTELGIEENDESVSDEILQGLAEGEAQLEELELSAVLNGKYDNNDAILTITAGAGGTDACDWAEMVLRMYRLWAGGRGYGFDVVSFVEGDSAGFRNVTVRVEGRQSYGYLKAEQGVHRLVRLSPFDSSRRRHTSFASVDVIPELAADEEIEVNPEELRIDTFRSSGAGGQHVNKTDSAVRITHLPTGITAQCQSDRSQHANRRGAMQILKARLAQRQRDQLWAEINNLRGEKQDISFASQIRSYVLHPYTMVKDHRTGVEEPRVQKVLDGEIDQFIRSYLQTLAGGGGEQ